MLKRVCRMDLGLEERVALVKERVALVTGSTYASVVKEQH